MNGCHGHTTRCDGVDLMPVRFGLRREVVVMCAACRTVAAAMGSEVGVVQVVERRQRAVRVSEDRRRFVPAWLRGRRLASDRTGWLRA